MAGGTPCIGAPQAKRSLTFPRSDPEVHVFAPASTSVASNSSDAEMEPSCTVTLPAPRNVLRKRNVSVFTDVDENRAKEPTQDLDCMVHPDYVASRLRIDAPAFVPASSSKFHAPDTTAVSVVRAGQVNDAFNHSLVRAAIRNLVPDIDLCSTSIGMMRGSVEMDLGLRSGALDVCKGSFNQILVHAISLCPEKVPGERRLIGVCHVVYCSGVEGGAAHPAVFSSSAMNACCGGCECQWKSRA